MPSQEPLTDAELDELFKCPTPVSRALFVELVRDLETNGQTFGVSWWAGYGLTTKARILIADQLVSCSQSVGENLREAGMHLVELHAARAISTRLESRRFSAPGVPMAPNGPEEEMAHARVSIHLAGLLRALGSALDCLAGVAVGVGAVPTSIFRADLPALIRTLTSPPKGTAAAETKRLHELLAFLESSIADAGPSNWLGWLFDFRNMLVHRGRHLTQKYAYGEPGRIVNASGGRTYKIEVFHLFPLDPGRAEVEVFRDARDRDFKLTEDAGRTVDGLFTSTLKLVEVVSAKLLELWRERRANPPLIEQPASQWRPKDSAAPRGFRGYAPGSLHVRDQEMIVGDISLARLKAAAISENHRHVWDQAPEPENGKK